MDSIGVNRDPSLDNEGINGKYSENMSRDCSLLRFNQTRQNYLKVKVGESVFILKKNAKT